MSDIRKLAKMLEEAEQSLVPDDLRALGWRYIDPPTKFSHEMWDYFRELIGMDEHQLLIYSEGEASDPTIGYFRYDVGGMCADCGIVGDGINRNDP